MTTEPPTSANLVDVRGAALTAGDSRERHQQVLARITLDSMVQFVGLLDAHGTVLEINRVALDAVGITLSEVEGKPFWTTFWWQVSEEIRATLRAAIERAARGEFVRWDTEIYGRAGGSETIVIDASLWTLWASGPPPGSPPWSLHWHWWLRALKQGRTRVLRRTPKKRRP